MTTPPPVIAAEKVYCPRCKLTAHRDDFRTVMAYVPAGFSRKAPALTVLKHPACKMLVYVPAIVRARPQLRAS